jgi:hypothetical protein
MNEHGSAPAVANHRKGDQVMSRRVCLPWTRPHLTATLGAALWGLTLLVPKSACCFQNAGGSDLRPQVLEEAWNRLNKQASWVALVDYARQRGLQRLPRSSGIWGHRRTLDANQVAEIDVFDLVSDKSSDVGSLISLTYRNKTDQILIIAPKGNWDRAEEFRPVPADGRSRWRVAPRSPSWCYCLRSSLWTNCPTSQCRKAVNKYRKCNSNDLDHLQEACGICFETQWWTCMMPL